MASVKCPKCASSLALPEARAGGVAACPKCGQKFRLRPAAANPSAPSRPDAARPPAKPAPARTRPAADDEDDQPYDVRSAEEEEEPEVPRVRRPGRRPKAGGDGEPPAEQPDRDDEAPRPRKRKKKKKKEPQAGGLKGVHIALIVVGVVVVLGATGLFFLIQRGAFTKAKPDPSQVLAELQQAGAMIERDKGPDQAVVGIDLSSREFRPSLLGRLVVFPQLRKLNLASTKTSDINLEHLEDVTTLQSLNLSHTKVTGGGMQFLKNMVNLEELNLNQTLVTDIGLRELKGLTKLKRLHLDGTLASGEELKDAIPGLQVFK